MKIFHQSGHNTIWNKRSLNDYNCGDNIILSPVHNKKSNIEAWDVELKNKCLFDPQFYVPDSQKTKLNTYDFFPEKIMDGFSTHDYSALAYDAARLCVDYQIENDFESIIIPARYYNEMVTDFIEKQKAFSVEPFLKYLSSFQSKKNYSLLYL